MPLLIVIAIYFWGPDFLAIIFYGMPLQEGGEYYAGNGWYYLGRDLDFYIEGSSIFAVDSIWRLMPLAIVLPQLQELIFIGIFQVFCFLLLTRYFYSHHHDLKKNSRSIDYSMGKSLQICLILFVGLGLIFFSIEISFYLIYKRDIIFEYFVSSDINQQKLILHPLYFFIFSLVACLGAAIFEETFFRKILFPLLRNKMPFLMAALLNALLFASLHEINWMIFIQSFIGGFLSCLIYEYSKSILGCILFHFLGNFCLISITTFYPLSQFH